jgi:hypothetical protein
MNRILHKISLCAFDASSSSKAREKRKEKKGVSAPTAMPTASKARASSTIPPEIWSKIFHIATFIPNEWDVVASRIEMGIFCPSDNQLEAHHAVLALRRSIVRVCRAWHTSGTKLLYASFYSFPLYSNDVSYRLAAFARVLVARPHFGCFVRRLCLLWSPTVTDNALVLRHCPNAIIFSSLGPTSPSSRSSLWMRALPASLRSLEANVAGITMTEIMRILLTLPTLELLSMSGFGEETNTPPPPPPPPSYPRLRFPVLRFLTLWFITQKAIKSWVPVLSTLDAPRLVALNTDLGKLGSAVTAYSRILEQITYLGVEVKSYCYFRPVFLRNLHHLAIPVERQLPLPKLQKYYPFRQLERLTLVLLYMRVMDVEEWKPFMRQLLAFPLDTRMMPSLRVLELDWRHGGIEASVKHRASHKDIVRKFLISLGSLAEQVEKRGVCFLEIEEGAVYYTPTLIQEVVAVCKKHVL